MDTLLRNTRRQEIRALRSEDGLKTSVGVRRDRETGRGGASESNVQKAGQ